MANSHADNPMHIFKHKIYFEGRNSKPKIRNDSSKNGILNMVNLFFSVTSNCYLNLFKITNTHSVKKEPVAGARNVETNGFEH